MLGVNERNLSVAHRPAPRALALKDRAGNIVIIPADNADRHAVALDRYPVLSLGFVRIVFQDHTVENAFKCGQIGLHVLNRPVRIDRIALLHAIE